MLLPVALACLLSGAVTAPPEGSIAGVVANLSEHGQPAVAVEVELRAELDGELDGELVPVARTQTDQHGRFAFRGVPLDRAITYVAGANYDGVYYASEKFTLGPERHSARVRLDVRGATADASPLVIRRHEIVMEAEVGALHVTEALLIDNPTAKTYVGRAAGDAPMPVTLALGIPADFERLTFEEEFYGRNFALVDGRVVTSIPWEPGKRWLRFTYSARNEQSYRRWERRIDAPCEQFVVRVVGDKNRGVECSLPPVEADASGHSVFAAERPLAAGEVIWIGLGDLPVAWTVYARWSAVALLVAAIVGLGVWARRRRWAGANRSAKPALPQRSRSGRRRRAA